jgi:hypothetical protein
MSHTFSAAIFFSEKYKTSMVVCFPTTREGSRALPAHHNAPFGMHDSTIYIVVLDHES